MEIFRRRNILCRIKTPIEESFQVEMESGEMTSNEWNKHIAEEMLNEINKLQTKIEYADYVIAPDLDTTVENFISELKKIINRK